jgi:phospholipase/carboxylesterase
MLGAMNAKVVDATPLQYVLVTPEAFEPDGSYPLVILMHGFGANMYDLAGLSAAIDDSGYVYAYPNAPYPLGGGGGGFSWMLGRPGVEAPPQPGPGLEEMLDAFMQDVRRESGAKEGNIVLGGFSQGAGQTLRYGLPRPDDFAGLVVLSGFFRDADELRPRLPAKRDIPIFMAHGRQDQVVALAQARETKAFLEEAGYKPLYREYDMAHQVSEGVLRDLSAWLLETLPPRS